MQSHNLVEIEGAAELFEEAAETWGHMLATEFRSSTYAEDVDNALQSLGYVPVREDTSSGLAVDFMLYLEDGNVAVEVDGPSHLNRTTLGPNGRTRLKQRMLRSMGYKLLCGSACLTTTGICFGARRRRRHTSMSDSWV